MTPLNDNTADIPTVEGTTAHRIVTLVICTATLLLIVGSAALAATSRHPMSSPPPSTARPATDLVSQQAPDGYWLVGSDGGVFSYGGARFFGSTGANT